MLSNECLPGRPWSPFIPFCPSVPMIIKRKKKDTYLYNLKCLCKHVFIMDFTQSTLAGLHVWALMSALQASISQVGVLLPIVLRADLTHSENKDGASCLLK